MSSGFSGHSHTVTPSPKQLSAESNLAISQLIFSIPLDNLTDYLTE